MTGTTGLRVFVSAILATVLAGAGLGYALGDQTPNVDPITAAEGVAADAAGNVYGAVVPAQRLQKHVKK